ncbi:MAG: hypothetical protein E7B34_30560, partial [Hafnia alvei]|nr:hypothetical protein [Hafnia alvei]
TNSEVFQQTHNNFLAVDEEFAIRRYLSLLSAGSREDIMRSLFFYFLKYIHSLSTLYQYEC